MYVISHKYLKIDQDPIKYMATIEGAGHNPVFCCFNGNILCTKAK